VRIGAAQFYTTLWGHNRARRPVWGYYFTGIGRTFNRWGDTIWEGGGFTTGLEGGYRAEIQMKTGKRSPLHSSFFCGVRPPQQDRVRI